MYTSDNVAEQISRAREIKQFLNGLNIGYGDSESCNFLVGPKPFYITLEENNLLTKQGKYFQEWLDTTSHLCTQAYRNPQLHWLVEIIEGNADPGAIEIHRRAHKEKKITPPLFARADMSDIGKTVEAQIPGSGLGIMSGVHATVTEKSSFIGLVQGFGLAMKEAIGTATEPAAYILYNRPFFNEVKYFCEQCQKAGIPVKMYFEEVPAPEEVCFVRRPPLEDLVQYPGADRLIEAHFCGNLVLEPDLSLLYDQKIAVAFPFDHRLRSEYSEEVRSLFPESYLIQDEVIPFFHGEYLAWEKIATLSSSQRQFIVKFGGAKKGLRAGGKAVFNLSTCNHKQAQQIIHDALVDWRENRSPWLIQSRVIKKFDVNFFDPENQNIKADSCYALFRPMYLFHRNKDTPLIVLNHVLFRRGWKVHGASDAIIMPVEIKE